MEFKKPVVYKNRFWLLKLILRLLFRFEYCESFKLLQLTSKHFFFCALLWKFKLFLLPVIFTVFFRTDLDNLIKLNDPQNGCYANC